MELHEEGIGGVLQEKIHRPENFASPPKQRIDNIAHLYSQLQAAFDKSTTARTTGPHRTINHTNSFRPTRVTLPHMRTSSSSSNPTSSRSSTESGFYTPSNSSSNTNSPITPHPNNTSSHRLLDVCTCHHWLVSIDSEHCGICDEPLPKLQQWQIERNLGFQTIERRQSQLERLKEKKREYEEQIQHLVQDIHNKETAIEHRTNDLESLQQDLKILHTKCKGERQQVQEIQKSKESVKRELEELSQRLFEEANEMVLIEREEKKRIEVEHEKYKQQLGEAQRQLGQVESELQTLRKEMGQLGEPSPRPTSSLSSSLGYDAPESSSSSDDPPTPNVPMGPETVLMRAQIDITTQHNYSNSLPVQIDSSEDEHCLMEFRQFIDTASTISLRKLHSLPYMKQCLEDDVRPTLRFGPNPRLASRKIIDAILVKTCFVEMCPPGFVTEQLSQQQAPAETITSLWERFSLSPVFQGCQACGREIEKEEREHVLLYRFRTSYFDEWTCVDRFCRDRIETVIQFYSFLRQLRIGAYRHRSLTEVYQECSRLRLQMALSRMGALPAVLQGCGFDPDTPARATPGSSNIMHLAPDDVNSTRLSSSTASTASTLTF